jgi:hypothetical protein
MTALLPDDWPRWAAMWALAVAVFVAVKWLTYARTPTAGVSLWRRIGYLVAWPGLDAEAFFGGRSIRPSISEGLFAAAKTAFGLVILFGLCRHLPRESPYLVGWIGMVGLIFVLHFGTFHLLSWAWRSAGVDAKPLMNWPIASRRVSEFWGRRWNTAFRDLTHRFLFRPLSARLGPRLALGAGFVFSGLVHDLVISVPAGGGCGGPTLYFAIQGLALLAERSRFGRRLGLGNGGRGRLFAAVVLIGPAVLLFHPPFVVRIVVPFLEALGAV